MKENIKNKIKKIPFVHTAYKELWKLITPNQNKIVNEVTKYNISRFYKYSGAFNESKVKDEAYITWLYHVIEKGLSMPDMRLGFGKDKVLELSKKTQEYKEKYNEDNDTIKDALSVLLEYERIHNKENYELDEEVKNVINDIKINNSKIKPTYQKEITKDEFFKDIDKEFVEFSNSRHCVRDYSNERIDINDITAAIDIARNAPSACNRQPARVHVIREKEIINKCLKLQNGNRGFGHLTDTLLIVTGDLRTILGASEFFDLNTNVGIFIMNLCYTLHLKKIGCCVLNWYVRPKDDKELRRIVSIPDEENIVAFISCGIVKDKFKLAESPRLDLSHYMVLH